MDNKWMDDSNDRYPKTTYARGIKMPITEYCLTVNNGYIDTSWEFCYIYMYK